MYSSKVNLSIQTLSKYGYGYFLHLLFNTIKYINIFVVPVSRVNPEHSSMNCEQQKNMTFKESHPNHLDSFSGVK